MIRVGYGVEHAVDFLGGKFDSAWMHCGGEAISRIGGRPAFYSLSRTDAPDRRFRMHSMP